MKFNSVSYLGFSILALFFGSFAKAGVEHGNGGDVVVCYSDPIRMTDEYLDGITLLDFYEGQQLRALTPSLGAPNLDPVEKAKIAFERLRSFDAARADYYIQRANNFMANVRFVTATIPDIPDQGDVLLPDDCKILQIAKHAIPQFPLDKEFIIRSELWNRSYFDNTQKAGLIIHEIIYADAVERGQVNSINARYFTQYLASDQFSALSMDEYQQLMLNTMMDEHVEYDYPTSGVLLRYFGTKRMNYADARSFCESLDFGSSRLSTHAFTARTHIGRGILQPNLSGSAAFWIGSDTPGEFPLAIFSRDGFAHGAINTSSQMPFLCSVDTSDL